MTSLAVVLGHYAFFCVCLMVCVGVAADVVPEPKMKGEILMFGVLLQLVFMVLIALSWAANFGL